MGSVDLKVDWCSYEAAKYAVEHWHYSRTVPVGKRVMVGAWEDGIFIGSVVWGMGATASLAKHFGVTVFEVAELERVALNTHVSPTSSIVAAATRMVVAANKGLRILYSCADTRQQHIGVLYQALNWIYIGKTNQTWLRVNGNVVHPRALGSHFGRGTSRQSVAWLRQNIDPNAQRVDAGSRHRYVMPLDRAMRRKVEKMRQPYPKRETRAAADIDGAPLPEEQGGAEPTRPLQD